MRKIGFIVTLVWLLLTMGMTLAQDNLPVFETVDCPRGVSSLRVECGYLLLPENRAEPDDRTIRLMVVIYRARTDTPEPDPLIYLAGGPGGNTVSNAQYLISQGAFGEFLEKRDVIFFDQRGTQSADPFLVCWELYEVYNTTFDRPTTAEEERILERDAALACHDRLEDSGISLEAYTSSDNAADINDLRLALGYEQVNLYGISYGTKLALTTMRDFPAAVRSVVLDSAYPPQIDLASQWANNAERAFGVLFAACTADPDCDAQYPALESAFYQAVERLDNEPVTVTLRRGGGSYRMFLNGDRFIRRLFELMYSTQALPRLPGMIYAAQQGEYDPLGAVLLDEVFFGDESFSSSDGMHYSVQCSEEIIFSSPEIVEAETLHVNPRIRSVINESMLNYFSICAGWHTRPLNPIDNLPVVSDIPALILAGEYDPATPPAWGRLVAQTLSHSFYYKFPGVGHGVRRMDGECWLDVALAFIDNPLDEPDTACINQLSPPRFR